MEQIDSDLRSEGVPIHGRSIRGALKYSKMFGLNLHLIPTITNIQPDRYHGDNLSARIAQWFDNRYGDRQSIYFGLGESVLIIRGDAWKMRLPRIYGQVQILIDRDLCKYEHEPNVGTKGIPPNLNVLTLIECLPAGLSKSLTASECRTVFEIFRSAFADMIAIEKIEGNPYIAEARSDLKAAVDFIFASLPHYGQSAWSSSQAAEKFLKCYLSVAGGTVPHIHDIPVLVDLVTSTGVSGIDDRVIKFLEVKPAARYGEVKSTLEQAVAAHHAALEVGGWTARNLGIMPSAQFS